MWTNRTKSVCAFALAIMVALATKTRAEDKDVFTDPKKAGDAYQVQGEYEARGQSDNGGDFKFGLDIIALGDGKYRSVGYPGGLPGDGWNQQRKFEREGTRKDNGEVVFVGERGTLSWRDGTLVFKSSNGEQKLKKKNRKSPTLGKKPPKGAVVLFDGRSVDNFPGSKMTDDGLLMQGGTSKQKFQDMAVHIEFRTPFMPKARGQGRGNSGIYLQGRYEVQMLDSFGLEGEDNECGGIYEIRKPNVNMCYPPLAWQTYDIDFTAAKFDDSGKKTVNAKITVVHNGVLIHENVEIPRSTRASPVKEGPEPGPIYVQDHGNPVRYRNIWVVPRG